MTASNEATGGAAGAAAGSNSGAAAPASKAGGVPSRAPGFRGVGGFTDSYIACGQTDPPSIPISKLFPNHSYPAGQEMDHAGDFNAYRVTSAEKRALERASEETIRELREAAETHRHVRKYAQSLIKPGIKLADFCEQLENMNRKLVQVRCVRGAET